MAYIPAYRALAAGSGSRQLDAYDGAMASDPKATCQGTNARGERCAKRAVRGRFCLTHAGVQDMRELGRKGGSVRPSTKLRQQVGDDLREQAREVLSRAPAGQEVDKAQLDAAKSLFSHRADAPPADRREDGAYTAERIDGRRPVSLKDVLEFAHSIGQTAGLLQACRTIAAAADLGGAEVSSEFLNRSLRSSGDRARP
jgi:hypothetical protein